MCKKEVGKAEPLEAKGSESKVVAGAFLTHLKAEVAGDGLCGSAQLGRKGWQT